MHFAFHIANLDLENIITKEIKKYIVYSKSSSYLSIVWHSKWDSSKVLDG